MDDHAIPRNVMAESVDPYLLLLEHRAPDRDNLDRDPEVGHQWPEGHRGEATPLDIVGQDDAEIPVTVVIVVTASPAAEENDGLGARCRSVVAGSLYGEASTRLA